MADTIEARAEKIADYVIRTLGASGIARRTPRDLIMAGVRLALQQERAATPPEQTEAPHHG